MLKKAILTMTHSSHAETAFFQLIFSDAETEDFEYNTFQPF
jgi:hypothetical protein